MGQSKHVEKDDSQAVGLDIGLSFIKWLTGAENLHYGIWTDLESLRGIWVRRNLFRKTVFLSTIWVIAHFGCGRRCETFQTDRTGASGGHRRAQPVFGRTLPRKCATGNCPSVQIRRL